ncbi:MAG: hypothetical protein ACRDRA_00350 [Pseudonocardiaceae bacterium]
MTRLEDPRTLVDGTVLVPDTLLPEIASLQVDLGTFIAEHHQADLLRVQTLDHYRVASDGDDYPSLPRRRTRRWCPR